MEKVVRMMWRRKNAFMIVVCVSLMFLGLFVLEIDAHADYRYGSGTADDSVVLSSFPLCYPRLKQEVSLTELVTKANEGERKAEQYLLGDGASEKIVYLPNYYFEKAYDPNDLLISCDAFFFGSDATKWSGALESPSGATNEYAAKRYLEKLGYVVSEGGDSENSDKTYRRGSYETAIQEYFGVDASSSAGGMAGIYLYNLYISYLNDGEKILFTCNERQEDLIGQGWVRLAKVKFEDEIKTNCFVRPRNGLSQYYAMSNLGWTYRENLPEEIRDRVPEGEYNSHVLNTAGNLSQLVARINAFDLEAHFDEVNNAEPNAMGPSAESGLNLGDMDLSRLESPCHDNAGDLSWVICPWMDGISSAASGLYEKMVSPFLVVNPSLVAEDSATNYAWNIVRGFANTAMIIFLLFIIFSQITGIGIDNYGIKKSLPKIIVIAIMINLSFLICQILVDLSNMLGNALSDLLSGIEVNSTNTYINNADGVIGLFKTLLAFVGGGLFTVSGINIAGSILSEGFVSGFLIPLFMLLVVVLIAILFFFLLLGVRKAGVVLLVILSPLAIVCYMLPNMKTYFDKWKKAFQGLLLLYPICGLLIGGGVLTSRIILSVSDDYMMYFTGCLLMVAPFFLIPSLLKGSFKAMGNIGSAISGFGNRMGSKTRSKLDSGIKGIRNSQFGQFNKDTKAINRAARMNKRADKRLASGKTLSARRQARLLQANKNSNAAVERRAEAAAGVAAVNEAVATQKYKNERLKAEVETEVKLKAGDQLDLNSDNLRTRIQNSVNEAIADNQVKPFPVDVPLAVRRKQSAVEAQEYKAYADQFAGLSRDALRNESNTASTWLKQDGGSQRMSALLRAMESQGMQKDIYNMLRKNDVGNDTTIMGTLATMNDKVAKAYGKQGAGMSYTNYVNGTGGLYKDANGRVTRSAKDANGNNNTAISLRSYIEDKNTDFLAGLDDKALGEINKIETETGNQVMSTNLAVEAAARMNSQDAVNELDKMLEKRNDIRISGDQLANMRFSTMNALRGNASAQQAILAASDTIATDPKTISVMRDQKVRNEVNRIRANSNTSSNGPKRRMI